MPYFAWRGVNIFGDIKRGSSFARTKQELSEILLKRDIAIISSRQARRPLWAARITSTSIIAFFQQLADLLLAGIMLPEALYLIACQSDQLALQEVTYALADVVNAGVPLYQALARHAHVFTPLMIQVVRVGEEGGGLASVCLVLVDHLASVAHMKKKLRNALLMPAITAIFFVVIAGVILAWVTPCFSSLFSSMRHELPVATRALLWMSRRVREIHALIFVGICSSCVLIVRACLQSLHGKHFVHIMALHIPIVGSILHDSVRARLMRSLAVLIHAGVSVHAGLRISSRSIGNMVLAHYVMYLEHAVDGGDSLSQAMRQHPEQWFEQHVVAMVRVGEESRTMAEALTRAANYYQRRLEEQLQWYTSLIQPLLITLLGILIAFFVCAIYLPIFNLANIV